MIKNEKIADPLYDNDVVQITTENIDYKSNNSSLFNTVNSITASGILAIPFALNLAGFIPGILFIILVWKISQFNFERLTMISSETQTHSFKSIVHIFYGKNLSIISEISIIWYTMSNLIARYIILDQFIIKIFEYGVNIHPHVLEKLWMLKFGIYFVFLPMSLMANSKTIKFASYLSLFCIPISVFIVVYSLLTHEKFYLHLYSIKLFNFQPQMFMAFGMIVMSFCGHFNLPKIYQELEDRNPKKMNSIIKISTTICFITYLVIGVSGYIMFEDATVGNVINNYPTNSLLALITRLCLTASLLFSTPFVVASNRRSLSSLLFPKEKKLNWYEYIAMTTGILTFSCLVSLFISRSEIVFSISGGTIGAFLMFVLPGLFLFKNIHSKQIILNQDTKTYEYTTISTRSGWLMVSVGVVFGALCIAGTIFSILSIK